MNFSWGTQCTIILCIAGLCMYVRMEEVMHIYVHESYLRSLEGLDMGKAL